MIVKSYSAELVIEEFLTHNKLQILFGYTVSQWNKFVDRNQKFERNPLNKFQLFDLHETHVYMSLILIFLA